MSDDTQGAEPEAVAPVDEHVAREAGLLKRLQDAKAAVGAVHDVKEDSAGYTYSAWWKSLAEAYAGVEAVYRDAAMHGGWSSDSLAWVGLMDAAWYYHQQANDATHQAALSADRERERAGRAS